MRRAFSLSVGVAAALACGPAWGQQVDLTDKRVVLSEFADCLVRMGPGQSEKLLRTQPGSPDERRAAEVLGRGQSSCLTNRMFLSMQPGMIRGLVAEAMFKRRHRDWLAAAQGLPMSAPIRAARPPKSDAGAATGRDPKAVGAFLNGYSACLVKADPAEVAKLLGTGIDTAQERDAILGFGDNLKDCMPFGVVYEPDIGVLRAHLGSALYLQFAGQQQSVAAK